jgi:predicted secreted protein
MDIWKFQRLVLQRLVIWVGISIVLGLAFLLFRNEYWNGMAIQFIAWAVVNLAIALFGKRSLDRRYASLNKAERQAQAETERAKLVRTLWVNTILDAFYIIGGRLAMIFLGRDSPLWQGMGLGIILQGSFLFFFDLIHARLASHIAVK